MTGYHLSCPFVGNGLCTIVSTIVLFVVLMVFAALFLYGRTLKERSPYAYYGLIGVMFLLVAGFAVSIDVGTTYEYSGFEVLHDTGAVHIEMINRDSDSNLDSAGLVGPNGTRSTMVDFEDGTTIRLRSNKRIISYLNSPENNITVLTTSGTKTVENVSELPSEYQKAPDGLINPDANIGSYTSASVATVACLYNSTDSFELGGRRVPGNVSIPCNTPVLAQDDSVTVGTSVKPTSGPNAGKTLTSPVTLRSGEYQIIGAANGEETVLRRVPISDEVAQE